MFVCILLFLQLWKVSGKSNFSGLRFFVSLFELVSCPPEYYVTDPNHSYCSNPYPGVIDQQVTVSEREHILQLHNYERRRVGGTNMERMVGEFSIRIWIVSFDIV